MSDRPTPYLFAGYHKFKFPVVGQKTYHGKLIRLGASRITRRWFLRAADAESYARRVADRSARLCQAAHG